MTKNEQEQEFYQLLDKDCIEGVWCQLRDYSALRASSLRVALTGDRRHYVASSNPGCFMSGVGIKSDARWKANCGICTVVRGFAG